MEQPELNPQYIINSLTNQIADNAGRTALQIANLNAVIIGLSEQEEASNKRIKELEMENKQLHEGKKEVKKDGK